MKPATQACMRNVGRLAPLIAMLGAITASAADAPGRKEGAFEFNACYSGSVQTLSVNDRLNVRTTRIQGSTATATAGAPFDGQAVDCTVIAIVKDGVSDANGYCVQLDPDGDRWMFKLVDTMRAGQLEFVGGTGKYEGMTLSGQFRPRAKPLFMSAASVQLCQLMTGTFRLR